MLTIKRSELEEGKERYENGLIKLKDTAEQVEEIEKTVKIKGVEAEKKKTEAEKFLPLWELKRRKSRLKTRRLTSRLLSALRLNPMLLSRKSPLRLI